MANQADLKIGDMVTVAGKNNRKIAFVYQGPQTEPGVSEWWDEDAEEYVYDDDPEPVETGMAKVRMVGDDHTHIFDFEDLTVIEDEGNVCSCGQLGCGWG